MGRAPPRALACVGPISVDFVTELLVSCTASGGAARAAMAACTCAGDAEVFGRDLTFPPKACCLPLKACCVSASLSCGRSRRCSPSWFRGRQGASPGPSLPLAPRRSVSSPTLTAVPDSVCACCMHACVRWLRKLLSSRRDARLCMCVLAGFVCLKHVTHVWSPWSHAGRHI